MLPEKTVERLSQYRRALMLCSAKEKPHIYSHELANLLHITPVQVRRDIMLIGYSGTLRKGYAVDELVDLIGKILDSEEGLNVCIVGIGNLGRAFVKYFKGKRTRLSIVAVFDNNPEKIGKEYKKVPCYPVDQLSKIVKEKDISIAILTVPRQVAAQVAGIIVDSGIKGIINYAPISINVPDDVYLGEYDMTTSLEKAAYFVKMS